MHSPIMCIGNCIPVAVGRFEEQSNKGLMWGDIGLNVVRLRQQRSLLSTSTLRTKSLKQESSKTRCCYSGLILWAKPKTTGEQNLPTTNH
ncbi:MAG: hypothetical protein AB8G99_03125 [Planctomycetaceae bacterium]